MHNRIKLGTNKNKPAPERNTKLAAQRANSTNF
jgi:hypothetical protein